MKRSIYICFALASALVFSAATVAAEDLDAALEAQKQKAPHRVYSERAVLDNQNLTVPQPPTDEELALDKKLREIEAQADANAGLSSDPALMRPATATAAVRPAENENWLTPAMLDNSAAVELPADGNSGLADEAARQKEQKEQAALVQEQKQVDLLVREKLQQQQAPSTPEAARLQQYQLDTRVANPLQSPAAPTSDGFSASIGSRSSSGYSGTALEPTASAPLFSPQSKRAASPAPNPLRQSQSSWSSPGLSSGLSGKEAPEPAGMSPLEMIKKSSPINRADPFADDHMPQFKSSIWE